MTNYFNIQIYLSHFLYFRGLNFVFSSFRDTFISGVGRRKVTLANRDDHLDNHLSDKFVSLCHIGYFINHDRQKLTTEYICRTFAL